MVTTIIRRAYSRFATSVLDIPPRLLAFLFLLLFLFLPITRPSSRILLILISTQIMAIFAVSWDLLVGRSGQFSLGHSLFFGVGAYASALLSKQFFELPLWATIPLSMIICALVALFVGILCRRMRGSYLALVTLALPLILTVAFISLPATIAGGENGISGLPLFFPREFFIERGFNWKEALYQQYLAQYYLTLLVMFVSCYILYRIAYSKTGIILVSILDDEVASKASGINTTKYKLMAFVISGLFAGLAGSLYAHSKISEGTVGPAGTLALTVSFMPVMMTVLGGIGTIYGPILGAYIITILGEYLRVIGEWRLLIYITIVILFIVKWPTGIARYATEKFEDLQEERELEEREKKKKEKK